MTQQTTATMKQMPATGRVHVPATISSMASEGCSFPAAMALAVFNRTVLSALCSLVVGLCILLASSPVWCLTTTALKDQTCAGFRFGSDLICTAGEFTVSPVFSAAPGTPPFCIAGNAFNFQVDLNLSGTNADRQDVGFFVGQQGNDPQLASAGNNCSVATFPNSPSPWIDNDGDACGDFLAGANFTTTINEIKVVCAGDSAGALQIPFVVTYWQNNGNVCTGPADVTTGTKSKCNAGISPVSGTVAVYSGAYVDVTKQTAPDGDGQAFSYTATGPAGSKVIALTGSTTLALAQPTDGTYTPATIALATNTTTVTLTDGQTARFYINALAANQTLTITEAATTNWESSAAISCAAVTGAPTLTTNNGTRTITAALSTTNSAAACTVTNTKRSRITLAKSVGVRVDASDQFTVSASGGGTLTGTTSATTSGSGTSASTTFYSTPNTALTLTDAKASGPTALTAYDTRLTCTNAFTGQGATPAAGLPSNLIAASTNITPAPGDDITCTYTNTKKVNMTLRKIWTNAIVNDAVNVTATGLTTLNSVANSASETDTGAVQTVRPGDVITIGETFTTGSAANYTATLACTGTSGLSGNTLTVAAADTVIVCTQTNTRKPVNLTLRKTWVNAIVNDAVNVTATGVTTLNSVANSASETDAGAVQTVRAGDVITIAEVFTVGSAANYSSALSCSGNATALAGTVLTVNSVDTAITCTETNIRKAIVTVNKSLNPASDGGTFNLLVGASTVAAAVGDGGTGTTSVIPGALTVSETAAGVTNPANYDTAYSCTGGITGVGTSINLTPTAGQVISCTFTNTRKATVTVNKSLDPVTDGGTFNLLVNATTVAAAVGNGGSGSTTLSAGTAVTVSEMAAGATSLADYVATYSCTGGISGSGTTISITPAAGQTITCTFINARKLPLLSILKSADKANANPGQAIVYTVQIVNSGAGIGASVVLRDDLSPYSAFKLIYGSGGFNFTDSSPASGLTLGTPEYSNDNGVSWGYSPVPQVSGPLTGCDGNITTWRIPMTGTIRPGGSFTLNYQVLVK